MRENKTEADRVVEKLLSEEEENLQGSNGSVYEEMYAVLKEAVTEGTTVDWYRKARAVVSRVEDER